MKRTVFCLLLLFPPVFLVGCAKGKSLKVEFVQGIVSLDGEPVASANISFIPAGNGGSEETAGGYSDSQGVYRITSMNGTPEKGAVAGEYRVTVEKVATEAIFTDRPYGTYEPEVVTKHFLPGIYRDPEKTPLIVTVKKGKNKIDLELKSKP